MKWYWIVVQIPYNYLQLVAFNIGREEHNKQQHYHSIMGTFKHNELTKFSGKRFRCKLKYIRLKENLQNRQKVIPINNVTTYSLPNLVYISFHYFCLHMFLKTFQDHLTRFKFHLSTKISVSVTISLAITMNFVYMFVYLSVFRSECELFY